MKRIFVVILVLAMLTIVFTGCSTSSEGSATTQTKDDSSVESTDTESTDAESTDAETVEQENLTIAWINPLVGHPVYTMHDEGCQMAADDYGIELLIMGPATIDTEAMVQAIENAIVQEVDGIVTVPYLAEAFIPVLEKAKAAGIPVVFTGNDLPDNTDLRIAFTGTDDVAYGIMAAELLAEETDGAANICIMMSMLDAPNQVLQKKSFEETLAQWPNMKVVVTEADNADMTKAIEKFEQVYTAYPEIDTVLMLEATGAPAAAKVAQEKGIDVTILAIDDVQETVDCIREGTVWATLAQNFYKMGYESIRYIVDYQNGVAGIPEINDSGTVLVTAENVNSYTDETFEAIRMKGEDY